MNVGIVGRELSEGDGIVDVVEEIKIAERCDSSIDREQFRTLRDFVGGHQVFGRVYFERMISDTRRRVRDEPVGRLGIRFRMKEELEVEKTLGGNPVEFWSFSQPFQKYFSAGGKSLLR